VITRAYKVAVIETGGFLFYNIVMTESGESPQPELDAPLPELWDEIIAEGEGVYTPQPRVVIGRHIDTIVFMTDRTDGIYDPVMVRLTQISDDELVGFRVDSFRGRDPVASTDIELAHRAGTIGQANTGRSGSLEQVLPDGLGERVISMDKPIMVARVEDVSKVGHGEQAFDPSEEGTVGAKVSHVSGVVVSWFRRGGRAEDGEDLSDGEVTEIVIEGVDGEKTKIVERAEDIEALPRAGGRLLIRRKEAIAGVAGVISVGAARAVLKYGRSRLSNR
jgi:hypothetical protein